MLLKFACSHNCFNSGQASAPPVPAIDDCTSITGSGSVNPGEDGSAPPHTADNRAIGASHRKTWPGRLSGRSHDRKFFRAEPDEMEIFGASKGHKKKFSVRLNPFVPEFFSGRTGAG